MDSIKQITGKSNMQNYLDKFGGATRIAFLVFILNLNALTWYALIFYPETRFLTVFAVFSNIISGVTGFFTGKSISESKNSQQPTVDNQTVQQG